MRIFHLATAADWAQAQRTGRYTTSTRGRTLAEEGFLHASRGDQWEGVRARFYADVTEPLVLLVIDTALLDVPVVEEAVADSDETFPHVYGALDPAAVVRVIELDAPAEPTTPPAPAAAPPAAPPAAPTAPAAPSGTPATFTQLFLGEVVHRMVLAILVMLAFVVGAVVGTSVSSGDHGAGAALGGALGLLVGLAVAVAWHRRRRAGLVRAG